MLQTCRSGTPPCRQPWSSLTGRAALGGAHSNPATCVYPPVHASTSYYKCTTQGCPARKTVELAEGASFATKNKVSAAELRHMHTCHLAHALTLYEGISQLAGVHVPCVRSSMALCFRLCSLWHACSPARAAPCDLSMRDRLLS